MPWLSVLVLIPAAGGVLVLALGRDRGRASGAAALASSLAALLLAAGLLSGFPGGPEGLKYAERFEMIPSLGAAYLLGLDGLSLFFVVLTALLTPLALLAPAGGDGKRPWERFAPLLFMESALVGLFCAADLLLFTAFFELALVPAFFMTGFSGGVRRLHAAVKLLVFNAACSFPLLAAVCWCGSKTGTFEIGRLVQALDQAGSPAQFWLFSAFALSFAARVPLFPLHTWFVEAQAEGAGPGASALSSVAFGAGAYGLARIALPLFPAGLVEEVALPAAGSANWLGALSTLAAAGAVYAGILVWAQEDARRTVAYYAASHAGMATLGLLSLDPAGTAWGLFHVVACGLCFPALYLLAEKMKTPPGGGEGRLPSFGPGTGAGARAAFLAAALCSLALPAAAALAGKTAALSGMIDAAPGHAALGFAGTLIGGLCLLRISLGSFFQNRSAGPSGGLGVREILVLAPLAAAAILLCLFPNLILSRIGPYSGRLITGMQERAAAPPPGGLSEHP